MKEEYQKNKTQVLYRGQKYKVQGTKLLTINGVQITMLKLPHSKYDMWVNSEFVVRC